MTRVALMHQYSWPEVQRGGERYLHDIAWYLQEHTSMSPHVVTARGLPRRDRIEGVPVHRTWRAAVAPLGRFSRRLPELTNAVSGHAGAQSLRAIDPTLVHAMSPAAARAATRAGLPTVFTTLGAPDAGLARRAPRRWATLAAVAHEAEVVTAVGTDAAARFEDALGRRVLPLHPGLRMQAFPPNLQARTGPPRVLFASTVTPAYKGFAAVLEAFPAVVEAHSDARLSVIGPGDVAGMVEAASPAVRRLSGQIDRRLPATAQMPAEYRDATVTVLASRGEAFGLVLAESLACGTPIVASSESGPAEILAGGEQVVGFPATPHDPDAIAEAVLAGIALAAEPSTPAACRAHATRWGWVESVGPRHAALYQQVEEAGGRGAGPVQFSNDAN